MNSYTSSSASEYVRVGLVVRAVSSISNSRTRECTNLGPLDRLTGPCKPTDRMDIESFRHLRALASWQLHFH